MTYARLTAAAEFGTGNSNNGFLSMGWLDSWQISERILVPSSIQKVKKYLKGLANSISDISKCKNDFAEIGDMALTSI